MLGLFWDVLAWGVMGNFRNTGRIIAFAGTEDGRTRLLCAVRTAAAASYEGRIEDAYRAFVEHLVPQLGWAFFTKILFFTGNRTSPDPGCLIFDSRVESALPTVTGRSDTLGRRPELTYGRTAATCTTGADAYAVSPEAIEARLYQLGRATGNSRRAWLSAEVSFYRQGHNTGDVRRHLEPDTRSLTRPAPHPARETGRRGREPAPPTSNWEGKTT